ncbi:MAG: hypothetical protein HYV19_13700 [Gemmatimonadetes bacterium]|nr:hypothetical protein [Gemmatimonadota bacterium]
MAQSAEVISHWHQSVESLSTSSIEFYSAVEKALRDKEVPELKIERVAVSEAGILSAKREYLSVSYGRLHFDICAAPFGKDFFFSWWLGKRSPDLAALYGCLTLIGIPVVVVLFISMMGFVKGILFALFAFGAGLFVLRTSFADGWSAVEDTILAIPGVGALYLRFFKPVTYYSEDTRLMFEATVHRVFLQVVEGVLTLNKLPQIPSDRQKPQSRNVLD